MDALKRRCWFAHEHLHPEDPKVDLGVLESYVERGRAALLPAVGLPECDVVSVSVKGSSQGDTKGLPCGARSLLVQRGDGSIVCRGVNKFFDAGEVCHSWLADPSLWTDAYQLWAVRKMAGFIITLFSLDGASLEVMSKHVLTGPHVDLAKELLRGLSESCRLSMAADLFEWEACASCECIRLDQDNQHPVLEEELFDQQLVLIALQKRAQLGETSLSFAEMPSIARRWGLRCVPGVRLRDPAALQAALAAASMWNAVYAPFKECPRLAEGLVLLVEQVHAEGSKGLPWRLPLRLKVKTPQYVVLRSFRSLLFGDSRPEAHLYHRALIGWLRLQDPSATTTTMKDLVERIGVFALHRRFERDLLLRGRIRHRGAQDTVGGALDRLHHLSARSACSFGLCRLTVVVMCGLPGAGKSSIAKALADMLVGDEASCFHFVLHLSRDVISCEVAARHNITSGSSKHQQRRLGALVHHAVCHQMRLVARYSVETMQAGLLLFDACNARRATRDVWRQCFPPMLHRYEVAYIECSDPTALARRAGQRTGHEVLHTSAEAQQALYAVRRSFQSPLVDEEETAWHVDTHVSSIAAAASSLHDHLMQGAPSLAPSASRTRLVTASSLENEMSDTHLRLLQDMLGLSASVVDEVVCGASPTVLSKVARASNVHIRVQCSTATLRSIAAGVLVEAFDEAPRPRASLVSLGRSLLRKIPSSLRGSASPATYRVTGEATKGHLKWIRGWLLRGRSIGDVDTVSEALCDRYERQTTVPHVTLLHTSISPDTARTDRVTAQFLSENEMEIGASVVVHLRSLLMDRHAVCFGVTLENGRCVQADSESGAEKRETPLHITVATTSDTTGVYAGRMFATFEQWQAENAALAAEQRAAEGSVHRSQRKYHNFIQFDLSDGITFSGVVEMSSG